MLEVIGVVDSENVDAFALAATRPALETEPAVLQASVAPGNRISLVGLNLDIFEWGQYLIR